MHLKIAHCKMCKRAKENSTTKHIKCVTRDGIHFKVVSDKMGGMIFVRAVALLWESEAMEMDGEKQEVLSQENENKCNQ